MADVLFDRFLLLVSNVQLREGQWYIEVNVHTGVEGGWYSFKL